ncbi:MAG TPA: hypothetical protein VLE45_08145 [Burkholderiaceae bacterium]|nr:hypothetical protein [Burkholderiaceae bacterium]
MKPATIASLEDLRAIERDGGRRWMGFDRIVDALNDVALRHGLRPALSALASAHDAAPRRWNYRELLAEVRRSAGLFRALAAVAGQRGLAGQTESPHGPQQEWQ